MIYDVIVCGGGVQGLWTTKYLLEQKKNVLLLEQFLSNHTRGSSHGPSRITRYSYEEPYLAHMMFEAFKRWNQLENDQKTELFVNCGLVTLVPKERNSTLSAVLGPMGITLKELTLAEMKKTFPGIEMGEHTGEYEKTAGVLKAAKCLDALQKSIVTLGGTIHDDEKVEATRPISNELVEIKTNRATYKSKAVILTCGAWINKVLRPLNLQLPVMPTRVIVNYWKAKDPSLYDINNFPATIIDSSKGSIYSTPIMEYPGLMKVCCHHGPEVDPDLREQYDLAVESGHQAVLRQMVKKHFPNLIPVPAVKETCMYSVTPDSDFILDRHPRYRNIIIGAGFSGHGFKLSPVVGRILGELALGKQSDLPIEKFSLKRFTVKPNL